MLGGVNGFEGCLKQNQATSAMCFENDQFDDKQLIGEKTELISFSACESMCV